MQPWNTPSRPLSKPRRYGGPLAVFAVLALVLGGCYLPVRFDAEIELTRAGYYKMTFDGYIAHVPLYEDLRKGKTTGAQERERVAVIETDFKRDKGTKSISYVRAGLFKVNWVNEGDILKAKMVTFIRRNANMLSVSYVDTSGQITIAGASVSKENAQRLTDMKLGMDGQLRVITDAKVVSHNATSVKDNFAKGPKFKTYTWRIQGFGRSPNLTISLY